MRDNMLVYRSFYEAILELPKENQAEIWNAVFELGLNNQLIELQGISKTIFTLIRPQIEANIKRYQNGNKAKQKQNTSKTEPKQNQNQNKEETNKNNNKNNNNNLLVRKKQFYNDVARFTDLYERDMLKEFVEYWTEHGDHDRKMRFEKEKTFGIERRLARWKINYVPKNKNQSDNLVSYIQKQLRNE